MEHDLYNMLNEILTNQVEIYKKLNSLTSEVIEDEEQTSEQLGEIEENGK